MVLINVAEQRVFVAVKQGQGRKCVDIATITVVAAAFSNPFQQHLELGRPGHSGREELLSGGGVVYTAAAAKGGDVERVAIFGGIVPSPGQRRRAIRFRFGLCRHDGLCCWVLNERAGWRVAGKSSERYVSRAFRTNTKPGQRCRGLHVCVCRLPVSLLTHIFAHKPYGNLHRFMVLDAAVRDLAFVIIHLRQSTP